MCSPCVKQLAADALAQDYTEEQVEETIGFLYANKVLKVAQLACVRESEVIVALDDAKASLGLRSAVHRMHAWAMVEVATRRLMPCGPSYKVATNMSGGLTGTGMLPAGWGRQNFAADSPAAWSFRPDMSPGACLGGAGWAAQVHSDMTHSIDVDKDERRAVFVPRHGNESDGKQWQFSTVYNALTTVGEMRRQIARCIKVPIAKVRLSSKSNQELKDDQLASEASDLLLCSSPDGVAKGTKNEKRPAGGPPLTKRRAHALQQELLMALESPRSRKLKSHDLVKHVQAKVLPSYGFETDAAGVYAMLKAFDAFLEDPEIIQTGDEINARLGVRPQLYNINYEEIFVGD